MVMLTIDPSIAIIFTTVFCGVLAFAYLTASGAGESRRLRRRLIRIQRSVSIERPGGTVDTPTTMRRRETQSVLGGAAVGLTALVPRASVLRARLGQAGLSLSVIDFAVSCVGLALTVAILAATILDISPWLATTLGSVVGLGLPHLFLNAKRRGQIRRFTIAFPDAIDLIVRSVRSGLPVTEAIESAAQESEGVVAAVFREVTGGLRLGLSLNQSLSAASRRIDVQEFSFFVVSLTIQQETGGNLSDILQNLSHMMRRREQLKMKIKAMSSEARASALIIGSLPFIMFILIYIVNQSYIMKFFIDPRGWLLLAASILSLLLGAGVMAKMVRFEV